MLPPLQGAGCALIARQKGTTRNQLGSCGTLVVRIPPWTRAWRVPRAAPCCLQLAQASGRRLLAAIGSVTLRSVPSSTPRAPSIIAPVGIPNAAAQWTLQPMVVDGGGKGGGKGGGGGRGKGKEGARSAWLRADECRPSMDSTVQRFKCVPALADKRSPRGWRNSCGIYTAAGGIRPYGGIRGRK